MAYSLWCSNKISLTGLPGPIAQLVASLTADPGVGSLIRAWSLTLVEINHEIIGSFSSFCGLKKGCCQSEAKVCVQSTG